MSKLRYALLLASLTLLTPSCQSKQAKINRITTPDETNDRSGLGNFADPPIEDSILLEVRCSDGYLVKKTNESYYQENYKGYFSNKETNPVTFQISKPNEAIDYPAILVNADNDPAAKGKLEYTYNQSTGELSVTLDALFQHIVFETVSDPALEIDFGFDDVGYQGNYSFGCTGSVRAVDFNGTVITGPEITPINIQGDLIAGEDKTCKIKVYGELNSFIFKQVPINEAITELHFNHGIKNLDFSILQNLTKLKKLYIGPDLNSVSYPKTFEGDIDEGYWKLTNLEKVIVDENNTRYDSRDNCGCLIDSVSDTLLLGGGLGSIPDGVKKIATGAFASNQRLTFVRLADSVTSVEAGAFSYSSVSYLELSKNLASIKDLAFKNCMNLVIVDMNNLDDAPNMKVSAFENCITLIKGGQYASFINNDIEEMIEFASKLSKFDEEWMYVTEQSFTTNVDMLPSFVYMSKLNPDLPYGQNERTYMKFEPTYEVDLGSSCNITIDPIKGISEMHMWNDKSREGMYAEYSANYNDVDEKGKWQPWMRRSAYCTVVYCRAQGGGQSSFLPINYDIEAEETYADNADDISFVKYFARHVDNMIPVETFKGLSSLTDFEIAKNEKLGFGVVNIIGRDAFEGTGITSFEFSPNTSYIDLNAFANCPNLKELKFNNTTRETQESLMIQSGAFMNDTSIEMLNLPAYITFDGNGSNPFAGCTSLKEITVEAPIAGKIHIFLDEFGNLFCEDVNKAICCPNSFLPSKISPEQRYPVVAGFYSTLALFNNLTAFPTNFDDSVAGYAFAYLNVRKLRLLGAAPVPFGDYAFAYCKNLEVLDLSALKGEIELSGEKSTAFVGTNPDFMVKIPSEKELENYKKSFGLPESKFFWDTPEP